MAPRGGGPKRPPPWSGDERWDDLLAALAEHLHARHHLAPPGWLNEQASVSVSGKDDPGRWRVFDHRI